MNKRLAETLSKMIFSASGWRGVFSRDGNEESGETVISDEHMMIAIAAAKVFSDYLAQAAPGKNQVIVGMDTRPTGKAVAAAVKYSLIAEGRDVLYTGIAAAPEVMAYARTERNAAGFIYISASHNPIGHNGLKFGLSDGGVLQADENMKLVKAFNALMASAEYLKKIKAISSAAANGDFDDIDSKEKKVKEAAMDAYRNFSAEVIAGTSDKIKSGAFFGALGAGIKRTPVSIAADLNGSARTLSIDREFLQSLGAGFFSINDKPGEIVHRIVPEGESLEPCRSFLEELRLSDPNAVLGYVPDCDGDRGNLVIWDDRARRARALEAQEVFALACVAELASLVWTGELKYDKAGKALKKIAIAVNDPTSMRIDSIARSFDAGVFRAEVGEANVVGLARKLRKNGYTVRILGEGSAGGTIIHPSAVRDPIDTLGAILKLLAIREGSGEGLRSMGLFEIWLNLSGQSGRRGENFTLADIIAALPAYSTTGAYTDDALLRIKTTDHGALKKRYQKIFLRDWDEKKETLKEQFGFTSWEAIAYNGMTETRGISDFGESGKGGLKIEFSRGDYVSAFIWMRGSGTEPVFRVMADAADSIELTDSARLEKHLIEWQRRMVLEADI